jgi:hypothetical protein
MKAELFLLENDANFPEDDTVFEEDADRPVTLVVLFRPGLEEDLSAGTPKVESSDDELDPTLARLDGIA